MTETKAQKFERIATRRINEVLDGYRLLSNLTSGGYSSTADQRRELISV